MDGSSPFITAMVGLAGAGIGGLTSFLTSWVTLHAQLHQKTKAAARGRREKIYTDFIKEATRLFGDALGHEREEISDLVTLYSLAARIRLLAPKDIIQHAERVIQAIVAAYLGPNRTLHELREFAQDGGLDPLREFSEACRRELEKYGEA